MLRRSLPFLLATILLDDAAATCTRNSAQTISILRRNHFCVRNDRSNLDYWFERFTNETGIAVYQSIADESLSSYEEQVLIDIL